MKKKLLFVAFACSLFVHAQIDSSNSVDSNKPSPTVGSSFELKGLILDAETGEPLDFATISIPSMGLGTASNRDGVWKMQVPALAKTKQLVITFLGYIEKRLSIQELEGEIKIRLQPKNYQIPEIVVTQRDFCKEFLQKAWDAIPDNYPINPSLTEGFYRETQRLKDSTFLYFNEAVLSVYKNTYKNNTNFGQIKVEKSRKNVFPGIDSINDVRFYGGPHFPNDLDIVFSRWAFIKPSEYKNWKIEVAGSYKDSSDNNSNIYVFTFKNKKLPNSNFQGKMFIDAETYAYVGFEFWRAGLSALAATQLPNMEYIPGMTSIKIGYTKQADKNYLSYINYRTNGYNTISQKRVYKDIDYVTTSIQTNAVKPIPFTEQFDYTDILSIQAQPYDSSYWKDYTILEESKMMQNQSNLTYGKEDALKQLTTVYNKELTNQEKTLLFLKRFTFDGGVSYLPIQSLNGIHDLTIDGTTFDPMNVSKGNFGISAMDGIRFELNKVWSVFGRISTVFYGFELLQGDLGINYRIPLAPKGRWVFLDLGLSASSQNSKLELGTLNNPSQNTTILGKNFDSEKILLKAANAGMGFKPSVSIAVRMGKQYELFTEASWYKNLVFKKNYLQLKEKSGGLFNRTSVKVNWNDPALQLDIDGRSINHPQFDLNPLNFRIGIRSGF